LALLHRRRGISRVQTKLLNMDRRIGCAVSYQIPALWEGDKLHYHVPLLAMWKGPFNAFLKDSI
jgi:hypothetical protein